MGSRYGGLKQLDAVGPRGETIIDYSVFDAARAGFGRVVFVIRRDIAEPFRAAVGDRAAAMIDVDYAFQDLNDLPAGIAPPPGRAKPWGTGHAVLAARHIIREPFAVITADDFYGPEAHAAAAAYLRTARDTDKADWCMVGYRLANTLSEFGGVSRGICRCGQDGRLQRVVETLGIRRCDGAIVADGHQGALTGEEIVSMTYWGFTPALFGRLEALFADFLRQRRDEPAAEFYLPSAVNTLIGRGLARVTVLDCDAAWFGVTYRQDKPLVQRHVAGLIKSGAYPSPLFSNTNP
ncbi:MAG: nucleotidyltransferase [Planctomycetes bacterium]|nr:nucleotidyltransferase [Planctomycetota bacterium]